jgi:hypothetical protein
MGDKLLDERISFKFLLLLKNGTDIYRILEYVYGAGIINRTHIVLWIKQFQDGREEVTNHVIRSGDESLSFGCSKNGVMNMNKETEINFSQRFEHQEWLLQGSTELSQQQTKSEEKINLNRSFGRFFGKKPVVWREKLDKFSFPI